MVKVTHSRRHSHQHSSRLRTYSFLATIAIIAIVSVAFYAASQPTVNHIPSTFEFQSQPWMAFVPSQVQYVGYVDYETAYHVSGNSSLFGGQILLQITKLNFTIYPNNVNYEVDIQLVPPQFSGTVSVISLDQAHLAALSRGLDVLNATRGRGPVSYDGYSIYSLLSRRFGDSQPTLTFMAVVNSQVILSGDKTSGLQNVQQILDQVSSEGPSLFDNVTVKQAVYATGVTSQKYLGLYLGMFPTQFAESSMVAKSVAFDGSSLSVTRALLFPSSQIALSNLSQAEQIYSGAELKVLDSWLVITYHYHLDRLATELSGI